MTAKRSNIFGSQLEQVKHMSKMTGEACRLAEQGFYVFELASGSKVPLKGSDGILGASLDVISITEWNKEANIGVDCGKSGLVVVDIDCIDKGTPNQNPNRWFESLDPEKVMELMSGKQLETPSGGFQVIFKRPRGMDWKSSVGQFAENVDIRCRGGYVLFPPSRTPRGPYKWTDGAEIDIDDLVEPPEWVISRLNEIETKKTESFAKSLTGEKVGTGKRNQFLASSAGAMRTSGFCFEEILAACDKRNELYCDPPLDFGEVRSVVKSVCRYDPDPLASEIATGSPDVDLSGIMKKITAKPVEELEALDESLLTLPNAGGELITAMIDSAPYYSRALSFGASLVAISGLLERKIAGPLNSRANLELICLASSGTGKDHPRKCISNLYAELGIDDRIISGMGTKEGLEDMLLAKPIGVALADEMDGLLQSLKKDKGDQSQKFWDLRLELYSSASSIIKTRMRAGKPSETIISPYLTTLSTAIPNLFYESLTARSVQKGLLSRSIILEAGARMKNSYPSKFFLSENAREQLQYIVDFNPSEGNLSGIIHSGIMPAVHDVAFYDGGKCRVELSDEADALYNSAIKKNDESAVALWTRASENTVKLALIRSILRHPLAIEKAIIEQEDMDWGKSIVWWSIKRMLQMIGTHMSDTTTEKSIKLIKSLAKTHGGKIKMRDLYRKMRMTKLEISKYIESLAEAEEIHLESEGSTIYVCLNSVE